MTDTQTTPLSTEDEQRLRALEATADTEPTKIQTFFKTEKLKGDIQFTEATLQTAVMQQASTYLEYAMLAARAQSQYDRIKTEHGVLSAELDLEYREKFATEGKKVTEGVIAAAVTGDARMAAATSRLNGAKFVANLGQVVVKAFEMRRDMLVQFSKRQIEEMAGQLRINGQQGMAAKAQAAGYGASPDVPVDVAV